MSVNTTSNDPLDRDLLAEPFTVLIADDEDAARGLVEATFCMSGLKLVFAERGDDAIQRCKTQLPDLAILDWQMPGATGLEVCQWIKANSGTVFVPVVLLTSLSEISETVAGLNGGADDYITKPFRIQELEARVRALLRIKLLTDELRRTRELLADKERQLVATEVAGAAAHELGQPLTSLLINCQLLSRLGPGGDSSSNILQTITAECARLRTILDQLSKLQSYKTMPYSGEMRILDLKRSASGDALEKPAAQ